MRYSGRFLVTIAACACALVVSAAPITEINHYIEDFTTKQFCDVPNTTAEWDTVAGEIGLPPFDMTVAGSYDTPDKSYGLDVEGNYAYVADFTYGLRVIDISDPTNPVEVGFYDTVDWAWDVDIDGNYAYVANEFAGLKVINISNPTTPTLTATYDTYNALGIDVVGDNAFVADQLDGLLVIDVTNPASPSLIGSYDTPGFGYDIEVAGDYAYFGDADPGLKVFDVTDPTSPTLVASYDTYSAVGLDVVGDRLYLADHDTGVLIFDVSDPTNPALLGSYDTGRAWDVAVEGTWAYVANGNNNSLTVLDVSNPANPTQVEFHATSSVVTGVVVTGEHAYFANYTAGLLVMDVADPISPPYPIGHLDTPSSTGEIAIEGDYAFVADGDNGLVVVDITDPSNPVVVGGYDTPGFSSSISISGNHAYITDHGGGGLQVIDISDPTNPTYAGSNTLLTDAYYVLVEGDYAYVLDPPAPYYGPVVLDVSDPSTPSIVASFFTMGYDRSFAISGNYLYNAEDTGGLRIIDISNPAAPFQAGQIILTNPFGVAIAGDYAYVADRTSGLRVVDITNPTSPVLVETYDTPGLALSVSVAGDYLLLGDHDSGMHVFDVSDPTNVSLLSTNDTPGSVVRVTNEGDYAYVSDAAGGMRIFQIFQRSVDESKNVVKSKPVSQSLDEILRVKMTSVQNDSIQWEVSADSGANWQSIAPSGDWNNISNTGHNLIWRSTHVYQGGVDPTCTDLQLDWLYAYPVVESVQDVPGDQGGWVRVSFTRSGYDFEDEVVYPISSYNIWQRMDGPLPTPATGADGKTPASETINLAGGKGEPDLPGGIPITTVDGRHFVHSVGAASAATFPPGTWELVGSYAAAQIDTYISRTSTTADSSDTGENYQVYLVSAHTTTPSVWYLSAPDSGYSVDNIAPAIPSGFSVAYNSGSGNALVWDQCPDTDFQYFCVYRDQSPDFVPSQGNLVHTTVSPDWLDTVTDGWKYYYKISAVDYAGNESGPTGPESATGVSQSRNPAKYAMYQNTPNPFNPVTTISYDLPEQAHVKLLIYDVTGKLVLVLADEQMPPGHNRVTWTGRDATGREAASGVYFYRLETPAFVQSRKMILLR